tara:strand:- start:977 stop:1525 length:549 start_codon:yes stop_codon:yes gene_type:complete
VVSLNTILAIGGLGAAYLIFKNLGGAAGIGSSIGQGFNVFGSNIAAGLKNANKFDNPLNTSTPPGFYLDPNENRNYDDYINYNDPTPTPTDNPPFVFPDPPNSKPNDNFMDQFTWKDRTPTPPAPIIFNDQNLPRAPTPPFGGSLEYVFDRYEKQPEIINEVVANFGGNPNDYVNPWSAKYG